MATDDAAPFTRLIDERTQQFTGREWVFNAVNDWLSESGGPHVFLLTGRPGTGKTAIAARIVQMHLGPADHSSPSRLSPGCLAYFHFCQAGLDSTLSPLTFVQSMSQALANRYPDFRGALERQGSHQLLISPVLNTGPVAAGAHVTGANIGTVRIEILSGDARPMFDQIIRLPLRSFCQIKPQESVVLLVDALDEALSFNPETNIAQLLRLVRDFPEQVRFLVTSRSNEQRITDLLGGKALVLDLIDNAPAGLDEVKSYATSRLHGLPEPGRAAAAARIAEKSKGNFLYAYHVLNDLIERGDVISDADTRDLPDELEDVYRKFLERESTSNLTLWADVYRLLIGAIAVARGDGLTKSQLIEITGLPEDTATDVLKTLGQYLIGGEETPYRIYHQSFRDFLLTDSKFTVYPADRHVAIARYCQDQCGVNWGRCNDMYALKYAPFHWAQAATASEHQRATRTQALIMLSSNPGYQNRFELKITNLSAIHDYLYRAVEVAALNDRDDMIPWLIKAAQGYVAFRRDYLEAETIVKLAGEGKLDQAEARIRLFADLDEDWQIAARLIIAWLGAENNLSGAKMLRERIPDSSVSAEPLRRLAQRLAAVFDHQSTFPADLQPSLSINVGDLIIAEELVKRIGGQDFNRELLLSVNPSLLASGELPRMMPEMTQQHGYIAALDAPILVGVAREQKVEGTALLDQYIDAHAGYNYVEYRNRSLWFVLQAVIFHHPEQEWVKDRLRRIMAASLTRGGVDFCETLPLTVQLLREEAVKGGARSTFDVWCSEALARADQLKSGRWRGADDSWAHHKRRLTGLMEICELLFHDSRSAGGLLGHIRALPGGFAGYQAPAYLRLADALRACGMNTPGLREKILKEALSSAHRIQDYHLCARITARCNALERWHQQALTGQALALAIRRLAASPSDAEFASEHFIHEPYQYRNEKDPEMLPVANARQAETLERLIEVFQRPAVDFRRLNPLYSLTQILDDKMPLRVPDPGFAPLLAVHFAARVLADESLEEERAALVRALVPISASNPTALDTLLSYLLIANQPDDPELLEHISTEAGGIAFVEPALPMTQVGPRT
jgi:hypothetical protein